jgi:hypothetical protein
MADIRFNGIQFISGSKVGYIPRSPYYLRSLATIDTVLNDLITLRHDISAQLSLSTSTNSFSKLSSALLQLTLTIIQLTTQRTPYT